ncbi:hypothetical protein U8335_04115 [Roseiconus lacunae]|uniref:hypothetical protein n=1 Tax=Roseiconus lacunae TaxID=2605694 RepID=UPI003088FA9C|nr:hypothetical protein U8335_04115 [Stieleria sp. HD01]
MHLEHLITEYELSKEVSDLYVYQLRYAVKRFEQFLGRSAKVDDLEPQTVNRWLKHERDVAEISDRSRQNVRTSLLTVWKYSRRPMNRDQIRGVVVTPKNPEAWHFDELQRVAKAAAELPGQLSNGVDRSVYMSTCLWFAFETGLRRRDIWRFTMSQLGNDGAAVLTQNKTRRVHVVRVTKETADGMRKIWRRLISNGDPHSETPLRWPQSISQFYYWMKQTRRLAGIDAGTANRSLQHIRRTGATEVELEGSQGYKYLGHSRDGLAQRCYIDARKTAHAVTPRRTRAQDATPPGPHNDAGKQTRAIPS